MNPAYAIGTALRSILVVLIPVGLLWLVMTVYRHHSEIGSACIVLEKITKKTEQIYTDIADLDRRMEAVYAARIATLENEVARLKYGQPQQALIARVPVQPQQQPPTTMGVPNSTWGSPSPCPNGICQIR